MQVTLVIPWLGAKDQATVYPNDLVFDSPKHQEKWIQQWVRKRTGVDPSFSIIFYPGFYDVTFMSILPGEDIIHHIPETEVCVRANAK